MESVLAEYFFGRVKILIYLLKSVHKIAGGYFAMIKFILAATIALSLVFVPGCSEISDMTQGLTSGSSTAGPKIVREVEIGSKWRMTQMEFEVGEGDELSILLKLSNGDGVDGFFYLEKGADIGFQITGNSLIYESKAEGNATPKAVKSDRFSFVASEVQGTTYTLTFRSPGDNGKAQEKLAVFLEVIYPAERIMFIPVGGR